MSETIIRLENVHKTYRTLLGKTKKDALRGVSFSVFSGDIFGLLGPNGAGKTTLIRMLCGLLTPTTGEITIRGMNPIAYRKNQSTKLGTLLEGNRGLYWRLSAMENLRYFGTMWGQTDTKLLVKRAHELLEFFDLYDVRNKPLSDFSRGMQQKVALALAMLNEPEVLLLDEPTLGLDIQSSLEIQQYIRQLADEYRTSIVLTSHNMSMVEKVSNRVAIINHGEVVLESETAQLRDLWNTNWYEFVVVGQLDAQTRYQFEQLVLLIESEYDNISGVTHTVLEFKDPRYFYDILNVLSAAQYNTIRACRIELDLETIFLRLTEPRSEATSTSLRHLTS